MTSYEIGEDYAAAAVLVLGRKKCRELIRFAFQNSADEHGVNFGPIRYCEGIDKDHGGILIGEAECLSIIRQPQLTEDLKHKDLLLLRRKTRQAYQAIYPGDPPLTDETCDNIINAVGPESAARVTLGRTMN